MKKNAASAPPKSAALTAVQLSERNAAALSRVEEMDDPAKLRNLMANADRMGVAPVREAALERLALVQTDEASEDAPGTIEHDLMRTIFAYEELVRIELGRAKRLTKTRMKMTKSGAVKALADFPTVTAEYAAFDTLMARGQSELTGEAVILRHADAFDDDTRAAATARLEAAQAEGGTTAA
jgi:hypothetical protein